MQTFRIKPSLPVQMDSKDIRTNQSFVFVIRLYSGADLLQWNWTIARAAILVEMNVTDQNLKRMFKKSWNQSVPFGLLSVHTHFMLLSAIREAILYQ